MTKLKLIPLVLILLQNAAFSQLVSIEGKIIDKNSKKKLPGVSVQIGKYKGTITNSKGIFTLQADKNLIKDQGITVSYIGYKKINIPYAVNTVYSIEMEHAENRLAEVIVSAKGKTIVERAISNIPVNYSTQPFILNGIVRVYNIVNDSDYYYKSDGIVQIYYTSYATNKNALSINLLQNRDTIIQNSQSRYFQKPGKPRWVGGYHTIFDFVYKQPGYINLSRLNEYRYVERRKSIFENRSVYVIDFFSKNASETEGTLYIDTASYAFVGADIIQYNLKEIFFTPVSVAKLHVTYQLIDDKWYIKNVHTEAKHVSENDNNYLRDFVFTSLDTINVKPFDYKDIIQRRDENIKIKREGDVNSWKKYDSIFRQGELANTVSLVPAPIQNKDISSTVKFTNTKNKFINLLMDYARNDNIRWQLSLSRLPISILKIQSDPQKKATSFSQYSFGLSFLCRIYNELFAEYDGGTNFGLGGLSNKTKGYYLAYNLFFNKEKRLSIAPAFGYNKITFFHKKTKYCVQQNLVMGINLSYEITHKRSYFFAVNYNHPVSTNNYSNVILTNSRNFSPSIGVIFKL